MVSLVTVKSGIRKTALLGGVMALAIGLGAPAAASSYVSIGYNNSGYYNHGYYGGGYYSGNNDHYYGHGRRHHRRHGRHRRGHGGGGKAAAIALGVIGGAIILNEVAEDRARQRAYDRRFDDRYDRYSARATPLDTGYAGRESFPDDYYGGAGEAAETPQTPSQKPGDDALEHSLDGGPEPIRFSYAPAYSTCLSHAREALADRDFTLDAPERPATADDLGGAWKMTANISTQNQRGESWTRAMYCEASESRVFLLELL